MENIVHIQSVLQLLAASEVPVSEPELILQLKRRFGQDMKIITCSDTFLLPGEVKEFMQAKGKIAVKEGLIYFVREHQC